VEGFFANLTRRRLKRGVFRSVADLQAAINRFVEETNSDPKPFVWTADAKRVLAAVKRGKEKLESIHEQGERCDGNGESNQKRNFICGTNKNRDHAGVNRAAKRADQIFDRCLQGPADTRLSHNNGRQ